MTPGPDPLNKWVGGAVMACGALLGGLSGLCSLAMLGGHPRTDIVVMVAIFGGVPFLFGAIMIFAGWNIWRLKGR